MDKEAKAINPWSTKSRHVRWAQKANCPCCCVLMSAEKPRMRRLERRMWRKVERFREE